ncbi:MAG: rod shape-determining protein MreC [Candidatus Komeilibacteria bacterium]|nr:rod shape-determining protein MreC [Candidatus Komeilibacteria bacterium]
MNKKQSKFIGVGAAAILLIFFHWFGWLKAPEAWLAGLLAPVEARFYSWGLNFSALKNYQRLNDENLRLKGELGELSVDYLKLSELETENRYLKSELDFLVTVNYRWQLAKVIGRLPLNDNVFIIDAGANSGLKPGLAVTVNQGVIIGKISQVEQNRSFVRLLNDTASQLAVSFGDQSGRTNGLLSGQAGNSLVIELIPQNEPVEEKQNVITSGLEELVPRGLLVGQISQVEQQVGQIFKQARVNQPFNYHNLHVLTIILKN